jgi:hypothetical protein
MATNFPTSLDSLTNPTGTDQLSSVTVRHSTQHANENDAIEALQAKVGINGSAVTTSHDYKLSEVTSSDKAVGKTATQTLTNKTLTSPIINVGSDATGDMYYRNASGQLVRLGIGTLGQLLAVGAGNIPEYINVPSQSDATTTAKGQVELAIQSELDAGTSTGGTGAKLVPTPDIIRGKFYNDYAASATGNDAYAITISPAITAYAAGQVFTFKADVANTAAATLNVSGLGAKTIKKQGNRDLATGDIIAGQMVMVEYDGTDMQLLSAQAGTRVKVVNSTRTTGTGTQSITGVGFKPRLVEIKASKTVNGISSNPNGMFSIGSYDGTTQGCIYFGVPSTNNVGTGASTSAAVFMYDQGNDFVGTLGNFGNDGFDIVWTGTSISTNLVITCIE